MADLGGSSYDDTYAALTDETRVQILFALADQYDEAWSSGWLSFSQLRERVGVADTSRFSYHLDALQDELVRKIDGQYRPRVAALEIVSAIRAGTYDGETVTVDRRQTEYQCPHCEQSLVITYQDHLLYVGCFLYRPGMKLLTGASLLATFVVGGVWVFSGPPPGFSGELSVGDFVVFILLVQQLTAPLAQLSNIVDWYENARASGKRICGLFDVPVRVRDASDPVALDSANGRIEYDDVNFEYDDGEQVLNGVDFTAQPGETIALVGPTGAGKSTVAKLLLRLYDADTGAVRVDGHDVRDIRLGDLRESIGYVSQGTVLFDGTVAENIRYGRFEVSDEAVREAARVAEAHAFIEELSSGYDTQVGERGVKLSGGQRQRIALSRAVLQDPDIIVLDEATASVDTETEALIQRSLERVTADRTTVAIAHRLSTIKDADIILVLDDGQIVERGSHEELLAEDGLYANLWGVQAGEIESLPDDFFERASQPSLSND
ncbi:ATP-binding cassette domain-containing protein [Halogeometricum borinquense]|uniref:ATP-binding cassette domain-containing protein n=1 Tax=Halogeometricum borinquense TaxID=60847 RepID=UPI002680AACA